MDAVAHGWNISSEAFVTLLTRVAPTRSSPPYMFMRIDDEVEGPITSTLSLTVFAGFNGTSIICQDGLFANREKQSATAMVFGECCTGCSKLTGIMAGCMCILG